MAKPLVAGDVSIDTLGWKRTKSKNERTRIVNRPGGALLLTELLRNATTGKYRVRGPPEELPDTESQVDIRSILDLVPIGDSPPDNARFRVERLQQIHTKPGWHGLEPSSLIRANSYLIHGQTISLPNVLFPCRDNEYS